ncbi:regulating synaptic membrane exocytosis protein 4-like [Sinocyclocheilus grahami]|uniref:regulating synaptic membrane exocytosis protein 4-like n=1 Tax=Sinocyclocheilus grahami TaxID=75366 RepID=UPI0007AD5889|nr:PREDICTED: regulating synaptic membrane exocytosis protein 4-like [Sinocyclocheilus grahami]
MERSQSRISLSASFEALAIYFPCMNSFDEDDGEMSVSIAQVQLFRKCQCDKCAVVDSHRPIRVCTDPESMAAEMLFVPSHQAQVIVWGNYGRMDRKCFMGVARILLEELDLTNMVIGWYKLFPTSSMVDPTMAPLIRHSSQLSLESTVGPCCERS